MIEVLGVRVRESIERVERLDSRVRVPGRGGRLLGAGVSVSLSNWFKIVALDR